jgi:hypothetical protein
MLRYPFATFLATFIVFSFLAVLIAAGEIRFSSHNTPPHVFSIESVTIKCAHDDKAEPSIALLEAAKNQCDGLSICTIDTVALLDKAAIAIDYACVQEITVEYHCHSTKKKSTEHDGMRATLYRGQQSGLPCDGVGS